MLRRITEVNMAHNFHFHPLRMMGNLPYFALQYKSFHLDQSDAKQKTNCDLVPHVFTLLIWIFWLLWFCLIFLVHVLKRAVKMNSRILHMENGGSCAHVWYLRLPYILFHCVQGERISHVLFLSRMSQPSRASRNYHWPPKTMQTNGACICLKAKDDYNQMFKATPDLLTFLI